MSDNDLRAGIEALLADPFRGYGVNVVRVSDLRALLAPHPVQECLDCGRTDGGCDRVVYHEDYMCPNCVTPWKCNGPHIMEVGE